MTDAPYRFRDDLPQGTQEAANTLDSSGRDLPESDWLPVGVETRWQAAARLLQDLEDRREIDVVRVLLALAEESRLDTADVERALHREAQIMRSNADENRPGGRPSKVDELARTIGSSCSLAARDGFQGANDQLAARDHQIRNKLIRTDISRRTYYRLRDRVQDEHGIDLTDIAPPSDML